MVGSLELGPAWHPCDHAAGHEHAPSRAEVALVARAHRQLRLHRTHHDRHARAAAADVGRGIGMCILDRIKSGYASSPVNHSQVNQHKRISRQLTINPYQHRPLPGGGREPAVSGGGGGGIPFPPPTGVPPPALHQHHLMQVAN